MGLGADKVALQKKNTDSKKEEEEVKIEKGTFVKIIAGKQSNNYGHVEGFDDDAGRLIIKLALGGNIISIQKSMRNIRTRNPRDSSKRWIEKDQCPLTPKTVKMVTKVVIKERKSEVRCRIRTSMIKWGIKKSERRKRRSESNDDSDSDSEKKRRRERSNSNSNDSYKLKRLKKSKKRKKHDCSSERSSKKHKRKGKEREKV
ncbi:G-patch domain and KOW motifs-containing protein-like isoform X2 [Bombus affinis]|uniref:G-patch domain and KOW motifs-containing protein-like isoform X2 n=1 Tax=Bombus affinis TaxID=309941 RepID=UPI0021B80C3D|nr:G-patch domain and KOW motifs-containing protein-like isoform X2 [Bombus affinis]